MIRNRKRKEPTLLEELKEKQLLEEGETVDIPDLEMEDLIEENLVSVIVRCLNPHVHKVGGLVKALPPIWGLEDRVRGRGVGEDRVQFIFTSESDLQHVLTKGPWFVNGWMVSLNQWSPDPAPYFLQRIPFWIRVRGLPIHMLKKEVVESLLGPLGKVELVELHAKHSNSLEYIRALVHVNTEAPLQFRMTARFRSGTTIPTELEYEKLLKICFLCKRLTHDQSKCPFQVQTQIEGEQEITGRSKGSSLRSKLLEKEQRAKEALQKKVVSGEGTKKNPTGISQRRDRNHPQVLSREDKRKGKRLASSPQLVWKQKGERGGSRLSRSTEESTATPKSSSEIYGSRNTRSTGKAKEYSEAGLVPDSVFNRLGSQEEFQSAEQSSGRHSIKLSSGDLRVRLSGESQEERLEAKSSKGSRSPPSVFERLGGQLQPLQREDNLTGSQN
ncbi:hypothetical protein Bca101_056870 [Brassica carinata]